MKPCQEVFLCQPKVMFLCWVDDSGRESRAHFWGLWPCQIPTHCQAQLMFFIIFRHALKAGNSNDKYSDALGLCIWGDYQNGGIPNSEIGWANFFPNGPMSGMINWVAPNDIKDTSCLGCSPARPWSWKACSSYHCCPWKPGFSRCGGWRMGLQAGIDDLTLIPLIPHVFLENSTQISSDIHYPWRICT